MDENIVSAIRLFFLLGLPPGSCTELLLKGEYENAKLHAHMMLREDDMWSEHVNFVKELVPMCCRNDNYINWQGYKYLTPNEQEEIKVMMVLQLGEALMLGWTNLDFLNENH